MCSKELERAHVLPLERSPLLRLLFENFSAFQAIYSQRTRSRIGWRMVLVSSRIAITTQIGCSIVFNTFNLDDRKDSISNPTRARKKKINVDRESDSKLARACGRARSDNSKFMS